MAFSNRRRTQKRCKKANVFPCKGECVPRYHWKTGTEQHCRNVAVGTPSTYLEWAKQQGQRKKAINIKRRARGETLFKTDKFGGLINPDKTKDGKLPETYRKKAEQARAIGKKSKDPKIKELAERTAQKAELVAEKAESIVDAAPFVDIDALLAKAEKKLKDAESALDAFQKKARAAMKNYIYTYDDKPELKKEGESIWEIYNKAKESVENLNQQKRQRRIKEWINEGEKLSNKYLGNTSNSPSATVTELIPLMNDLLSHIIKQNETDGYTPQIAKKDAMQVQIDSSVTDRGTIIKHDLGKLRESIADFYLLTRGKSKINTLVYSGDRAHCATWDKVVNVGSPLVFSKTVMFHELGHNLEDSIKGASQDMMEWVRVRSGQTPKPLGDGYGKEEIAYPDKFIHPYVGKAYPSDTFSEVVSMGIQHFAAPEHMTDLFVKDSEHFHLILGFLMDVQRR